MSATDPFARFRQWFELAGHTPAIADPTAMTLATASPEGLPSARIVLLKEFDERGFVFYTNFESRKSREIKANPHAALCFYWIPLERQIRIEGRAAPVSDAEADAYFATRLREKQIGAWSSRQSERLESREALAARIAERTRRFEGSPVPRPPFWSGWRIAPERVEFWQQGDYRLHEREVFIREGKEWRMERLYP